MQKFLKISYVNISSCSSLAPVKPKRCIARMMSSSSEHIMTASTPVPVMNTEKYRTTVCYQLNEAKIASKKLVKLNNMKLSCRNIVNYAIKLSNYTIFKK